MSLPDLSKNHALYPLVSYQFVKVIESGGYLIGITGENNIVYYSDDGGKTWGGFDSEQPTISDIAIAQNGNVYALCFGSGSYHTFKYIPPITRTDYRGYYLGGITPIRAYFGTHSSILIAFGLTGSGYATCLIIDVVNRYISGSISGGYIGSPLSPIASTTSRGCYYTRGGSFICLLGGSGYSLLVFDGESFTNTSPCAVYGNYIYVVRSYLSPSGTRRSILYKIDTSASSYVSIFDTSDYNFDRVWIDSVGTVFLSCLAHNSGPVSDGTYCYIDGVFYRIAEGRFSYINELSSITYVANITELVLSLLISYDFSIPEGNIFVGDTVEFIYDIGGFPLGFEYFPLLDFGDGNSSRDIDPNHVYLSSGIKDLVLHLVDSAVTETDLVDTITKELEIKEAVVADFSASITIGSAPLTILFTDLSSGNPTAWLWNFGDGVTSDNQNASHTYLIEGRYTVSLIASNEDTLDEEIKIDLIVVYSNEEIPLLIEQFRRERPNIRRVCRAIYNQLDSIEDSISSIVDLNNIDNAISKELDNYGDIVGYPRDTSDDDLYRSELKFKMFLNTSRGTPETLIAAVKFLTDASSVIYREAFPAMVVITFDNLVSNLSTLAAKLRKIKPAGVMFLLQMNIHETPFAFGSEGDKPPFFSYAKGFEETGGGESVGGYLTELIS